MSFFLKQSTVARKTEASSSVISQQINVVCPPAYLTSLPKCLVDMSNLSWLNLNFSITIKPQFCFSHVFPFRKCDFFFPITQAKYINDQINQHYYQTVFKTNHFTIMVQTTITYTLMQKSSK